MKKLPSLIISTIFIFQCIYSQANYFYIRDTVKVERYVDGGWNLPGYKDSILVLRVSNISTPRRIEEIPLDQIKHLSKVKKNTKSVVYTSMHFNPAFGLLALLGATYCYDKIDDIGNISDQISAEETILKATRDPTTIKTINSAIDNLRTHKTRKTVFAVIAGLVCVYSGSQMIKFEEITIDIDPNRISFQIEF